MLKEGEPEIEKPLKSTKMEEIVTSFYAKFVDIPVERKDELIELIVAANYMDIKSLLELACAKFACYIKEINDVAKVRELMGMENDFTPEEYAAIVEENKWADECL